MKVLDAEQLENETFPGGYSPKESAGPDYWFDGDAAIKAIRFIPTFCVHTKGELAGKPLQLEEWQQKIIGAIFGWKRKDGTRRYRVVYIEVPRKNGKTTLAGAIAQVMMYLDGEKGAEIYSTAAEREQAAICFEAVKENVQRNDTLSNRSTCYRRSIVVYTSDGMPKASYKVLTADANSKHGYNPSCHIADELHAHKKRELWDVMQTGCGARREPLTIAITTAGHDRESLCYEQRLSAERVISGVSDDETFLPVLYSADTEDDWTSEEVWKKANPNYGVSIKTEFLQAECTKAKENPAFENTFKRLYLNIWTEQATRAIQMQKWDACRERYSLDELEGETCYAGLDVASKTDIASLSLVFPIKDEETDETTYDIHGFYWSTESQASYRSKEPKNTGRYSAWHKQGILDLCPGERIELDRIVEKLLDLSKRFNIAGVAYDPWNAESTRQTLSSYGFDMIEFRQTIMNFNEPFKEYLVLISEGKICHGDCPILRWMAANLSAKTDSSGNMKPDKETSADKIDGQVSTIMGLGLALLQKKSHSVYEERGILTL